MKAIVKTRPEGGRGATELREVPVPKPGRGEVLVKVLATAICGTDKHIYNWDPGIQDMVSPPRTYGHEFCGTVCGFGEDVPKGYLDEGDYVSCEMHVVCGICFSCRTGHFHICENTTILGLHGDGCFAEYVKVPAINIVKLDREYVPPKIGSFLDAFGNAVHTALAGEIAGRDIAITGYGAIGAMAASVVHFSGGASIHITDVNPFALDHARAWKKKIGAGNVHIHDTSDGKNLEVDRYLRRTLGGMDVVLEMSGHPIGINDALRMAKKGGHVFLLGLPGQPEVTIENYPRDVVFKGITLKGIIGRKMYGTWFRMLALLRAGLDVNHVVTAEFEGLDKFFDAMDLFLEGKALKVVIYPDKKPS